MPITAVTFGAFGLQPALLAGVIIAAVLLLVVSFLLHRAAGILHDKPLICHLEEMASAGNKRKAHVLSLVVLAYAIGVAGLGLALVALITWITSAPQDMAFPVIAFAIVVAAAAAIGPKAITLCLDD